VQFYEDEHDLAELVPPFLLAGLRADATVIVVATATYREAVETAIAGAGIDLQAAVAAGRYVRLDAGDCLATLEVDGQLDPGRFTQRVGSLIEGASANDRPVRVYGEMVAILWQRGDLSGAVRLEGGYQLIPF